MIVSAGDKLSDVRWEVEQIDDRNSIFNILPSAPLTLGFGSSEDWREAM